jgi:serine phosphatase RsbU (regulator of sigma subunit)
VLVFAFLALAGVAAFAYFSYRQALSQLVIERDQQLAYLSASRLSDEFAKFTEVLDSVSESPGLAADERLQRRRALQDASARLSVFDGGAVLLDNFGTVVGTEPARPDIIGSDWSDRDFFRDLLARRQFVLSDALPDGPDGSWVVVMAVPVRSESGEFLGALAGMFRLGEWTISPFYASIVRLRLGQSGNTFLVDGAGRILYDSDSAGIGDELADRALPEEVAAGGSGALRLRDESGRDVITAYAPIPGTEWVLVTEDDWALLMASVQGYARTLLILLLAASLLPAMAVILTLRQKNSEMQLHERQLQEDRVARLIHTSLRPTLPPLTPGWSLAVVHLPGRGVGGDFYDYFTLSDGRVMAAVGTVCGGSVASSVVMAATRTALRGSALRMIAPDEALGCSNELLCPDVREDTTVDCVLTSLDPGAATLTFALAGGATSILRSEEPAAEVPPPGPALGMDLDAAYGARTWQLAPGEVVLLASAGASLASSGGEHRLPIEALTAAVRGAENASAAQAALEARLAAALDSPGSPLADVTVLCIVRHRHA